MRLEHQAEGQLAGDRALPTLLGTRTRPRQDVRLAAADGPAIPGNFSTRRRAAERLQYGPAGVAVNGQPARCLSPATGSSNGSLRLLQSADRGPQKLRVAVLAPPGIAVPPPGYGGIETVVDLLCEEQVERGHDATLFAAPRSRSAARVRTFSEAPHPGEIGASIHESDHVASAWAEVEHAAERGVPFDPLHDHSGFTALAMADRMDVPVVHTIHGPFTGEVARFYERHRGKASLAISHSQTQSAPAGVMVSAVVPNPIGVSDWPLRTQKQDYLLWIGQTDPVKGADRAIEAARLAGRRLVLAGGAAGPGAALRRADQAASRRLAGALRRRGHGHCEAGAVRERGRAANAGPLGRAIRDGDGRSAGVRHAGDRLPGGRRRRDRDRPAQRDPRRRSSVR